MSTRKHQVKRIRHNVLPEEREMIEAHTTKEPQKELQQAPHNFKFKDNKIKCKKCNYEHELRSLLPVINQQSLCPECGETIYLSVGVSGKYDYKNDYKNNWTLVERLLKVGK